MIETTVGLSSDSSDRLHYINNLEEQLEERDNILGQLFWDTPLTMKGQNTLGIFDDWKNLLYRLIVKNHQLRTS